MGEYYRMRLILLALLSLLVLAPQSADAARRDERSGTSVSRTNLAASPASRASTRATPRATSRETPRSAARSAAPRAARTAARSTTRAAARTAARPAASSRSAARSAPRNAAAARQVLVRRGDVRTQRRGVVVRGAAAATISSRSSIAGWQSGLPAVTMAQRDCPVGTFAILARGHDDIVRCMPL